LLFLSSGEQGLADKIAEDGRGRRAAVGQQVRIVDIPADAGAGHGVFENLHGFSSGDALARHLKAATANYYGTAIGAYLKLLTKDFDEIAPIVTTHREAFVKKHCPTGADGQVSRVAARFGLIAAGGEMATSLGILPWPQGEATRAAERCFKSWFEGRDGAGPAEEQEAISTVRRFVELHGMSRFEAMGELARRDSVGEPIEQRIINRVGFRRKAENGGTEFLVLPEAWRTEICAGLNPKTVAKALMKRGMLRPDSEGKLQCVVRLPGFGKPARCYIITEEIIAQ
jgi:uncharacterized protein (DUF927 family)